MEFFLIWLLFGVVAAVVAWNKGRSVPGWLAIGFLLGPFGLILSLVMSRDEPALNQRAVSEGQMRKCPFCAEVIKLDAVKCRFCGSEVLPYDPTVICLSCGKRIKPRAKDTTCYLCKAPLPAQARGGTSQ